MKEAWIFEEGWESDEKTGDRKTAGEAQLARKGWPREWREGDERLTTATVAEEEKEKGGGGAREGEKTMEGTGARVFRAYMLSLGFHGRRI